MNQKVIPGPADHWYALLDGGLVGYPMPTGVDTPPEHPAVNLDGWCEISDPAPETDVAALTAALQA